MSFKTIDQSSFTAEFNRKKKTAINYGIKYLDNATGGIRSNDLIIIGGRTGCGKTELASHIALHNVLYNKKVHYFALEAEEDEIYNRLLYKIIKQLYYEQEGKEPILYRDWLSGKYDLLLRTQTKQAMNLIRQKYSNLFVFYRTTDTFNLSDLQCLVYEIKDDTDLIIIDHLHYIQVDTDKELAEMKKLVMGIRDLALLFGKPIILIAHLRKKSFQDKTLVPDVEEFHGSSDITKIATQVITLASNGSESNFEFKTLFKVCKCRVDGSATRYIGQQIFNIKQNDYEDVFKVGKSEDCYKDFTPITVERDLPLWGKEAKTYVPTKSLFNRFTKDYTDTSERDKDAFLL